MKTRFDRDAVLPLLDGIDRVIASRGTKVVAFDLKKEKPDEETLLAHIIGPTGNLRAPTARVGKTLLIGFNEDAYKQVLGT